MRNKKGKRKRKGKEKGTRKRDRKGKSTTKKKKEIGETFLQEERQIDL